MSPKPHIKGFRNKIKTSFSLTGQTLMTLNHINTDLAV